MAGLTLLIAESVHHHRAAELILLTAIALPTAVTAGRLATAFTNRRRRR
ncbi:hypothetical protein [Nonomuraea basaltis]|nr:hypothetical protein [Nonomuraea basaltis]